MLNFKRNERVNVLRLNETVDITWFIFQTYKKIYWEARCDSEIKEHLKKKSRKTLHHVIQGGILMGAINSLRLFFCVDKKTYNVFRIMG